MKVVLFAAGLGTRIRDYSEDVPKPMIPIGGQPILLHLMNYYSAYGHRDFVVCLGYKANVIKQFFLNHRPEIESDLLISGPGTRVEVIGQPKPDWRISLIDTGHWHNIGQRLWAVREHVQNEEMFMANYSDGLTDMNLDDMIAHFKASNKVACFLAIRPPVTYHVADIAQDGRVLSITPTNRSDIWINGGYFLFRPEIFDYMREGEELVVEPFARLVEADQIAAYKHEGFWRGMDTLRDRQTLEELIEHGNMPWRVENRAVEQGRSSSLK